MGSTHLRNILIGLVEVLIRKAELQVSRKERGKYYLKKIEERHGLLADILEEKRGEGSPYL